MYVMYANMLVPASDRLKGRREPRTARRGLMPSSLSHRHPVSAAQRVSGRMTKGKAKLAVLHEVKLQHLFCTHAS